MMLTDVMKAVDHFSSSELRQLREYIQQREAQRQLTAGTVNVDEQLSALEEFRAGLTEE